MLYFTSLCCVVLVELAVRCVFGVVGGIMDALLKSDSMILCLPLSTVSKIRMFVVFKLL